MGLIKDTRLKLVNPDQLFWQGKKVLLTGHSGFKGSWLSMWLLELGADVTGLSLRPESEPNLFEQLSLEKKLTNHYGDIRDFSLVRQLVVNTQPDVVFHLAAQPLVRLSYQVPTETWATNVMGSINILEALRLLDKPCSAVMITTDKVYRNNEWVYGYRENDPLGGYDPYSSSKAATEIAINSWRSSFCGSLPHQNPHLRIASARAGNVIGGGDWAMDRIVPDVMRALSKNQPIEVRNPFATRPWQHVLEPLSGYLRLAESLSHFPELAQAFNFGPHLEANRPVKQLVEQALLHWPGIWKNQSDLSQPHEANLLNLVIDKAHHKLSWSPRWNFATTVERTTNWYRRVHEEPTSALECCQDDLKAYLSEFSR